MPKYKLLYFVSEDDYFLSHKVDQARSILKKNFEVLIVCNFSNHEKKIKSMGFKTQNINLNRKSINPFKELICLLELVLIVFKFKPNLIQSTALKPILYTSIISFFFRRPKLVLCIVGLGYLFINKTFSSRIIKSLYLFLIKFFLRKKGVRFVFQNANDKKIITNNKVCKNHKTSLIPGSGVDMKKFIKAKINKPYDLIFHSRILYDKGFLELIEAIKLVKKKNSLQVLVLGSTDCKNRSSIDINKLKEWERQKLIIWKRRRKNVIPFLQKSKIAVLPSYREGLPKSLLEAASCELPLIAANVVGCRDICLNKYNGILVPVKNSIILSKAISKLIKNAKLRRLYGRNGRVLVKKKFSQDIICKEFLKIYYTDLQNNP